MAHFIAFFVINNFVLEENGSFKKSDIFIEEVNIITNHSVSVFCNILFSIATHT